MRAPVAARFVAIADAERIPPGMAVPEVGFVVGVLSAITAPKEVLASVGRGGPHPWPACLRWVAVIGESH